MAHSIRIWLIIWGASIAGMLHDPIIWFMILFGVVVGWNRIDARFAAVVAAILAVWVFIASSDDGRVWIDIAAFLTVWMGSYVAGRGFRTILTPAPRN